MNFSNGLFCLGISLSSHWAEEVGANRRRTRSIFRRTRLVSFRSENIQGTIQQGVQRNSPPLLERSKTHAIRDLSYWHQLTN